MTDNLTASKLGKKVLYPTTYDPKLLFAISRAAKRQELGKVKFYGVDIWNHYEVSWLNLKGKPNVAILQISYDSNSAKIVESKSLKLYFNSFNNEKIGGVRDLIKLAKDDLTKLLDYEVEVQAIAFDDIEFSANFTGRCLDNTDIECENFKLDANHLKFQPQLVTDTVYSNLLRSNCLITNQPDWGSVQISYKGNKILDASLLHYLVSFRNHNEFHEQCIERIFTDITNRCKPEYLFVYGRYTRRGGIDINPVRSSEPLQATDYNLRLLRQ